jgi:TRAP-type transport system small permease protein
MVTSALRALRLVEEILAAALLAAVVTLVVVSSSGRYFGTPVIWAIEVIQALFVWLCVLASDLTLQRLGHFSIDGLANLLPPRARQVLDVFNTLLVAALLAVLVYYGFQFTVLTSGRPLPMIGISSAAATSALPVGFLLMFITLAEQLAARLKGQRLAPEAPREVM